jgi:hypothetical protein
VELGDGFAGEDGPLLPELEDALEIVEDFDIVRTGAASLELEGLALGKL